MLARDLLAAANRLGIPVIGVDIRDEADRATWHLQYLASATEEQRQQGEALKQSYDPEAERDRQRDAEAQGVMDARPMRALIQWLSPKMGRTPMQARAELVAMYKRLP